MVKWPQVVCDQQNSFAAVQFLGTDVLDPGPAERVPSLGKGMHLCRPSISERVNIRKPEVPPLVAISGENARMNEDNDAITGRNEPLWLTDYFCGAGTRLGRILLRTFYTPVMPPPETRRVHSNRSADPALRRPHRYQAG
jgi:hypothetical protein